MVEFPPSTSPRPLGQAPIGTDPLAKLKLDELLDGPLTTGIAAIAIHDDQIVYERYRRAGADNLYPAWSITKSLVSLAVGHALCDRQIESLDDAAARYVPEARDTGWGRATIRQLLQMRSGSPRQDLDAGGDYLYAGTSSGVDMVNGVVSVREGPRRFQSKTGAAAAGTRFAYANMDTDTLGLVVAAATGQSFQKYFESTVLAAAKLEHPSVFHLDRDGHPVTHAYFFASLRDLARLGLYVLELHRGQAGSSCLQQFIQQALSPYTEGVNPTTRRPIGYGFQFWLDAGADQPRWDVARMSGHQGQDVFVNLRTGKVAVVLGWRASLRNRSHQADSVTAWLRQ